VTELASRAPGPRSCQYRLQFDERLWILIAPLGEHCRPLSSEQVNGGAADPAWTGGSTPADDEAMLE